MAGCNGRPGNLFWIYCIESRRGVKGNKRAALMMLLAEDARKKAGFSACFLFWTASQRMLILHVFQHIIQRPPHKNTIEMIIITIAEVFILALLAVFHFAEYDCHGSAENHAAPAKYALQAHAVSIVTVFH